MSQESNSQQSSIEQTESNKALNPTVLKLGLVSFFADISSEMLYSITPLFLALTLGASMTSIGLIEGTAECIASLLKTFSGFWSDYFNKRKPLIVLGYALSALAKPLIGFSNSWFDVILCRSLDRTGKGLRGAPRDALIADTVAPEHRGAAFGWHRGMDTLGAAIGPVFTIFYINYISNDFRGLFYWAFIPGCFSILAALLIQEKTKKRDIKPNQIYFKSFSWKLLPTQYKKYLTYWSLFCLTNSSDVFILMSAQKNLKSFTLVILMYCFYNLVYSLLSPVIGKLSDRFSKRNFLVLSLLIFSLTYLGFSQATEVWHYWLLFSFYGVYMAANDGLSKAFALDLIGPNFSNLKGTALGLLGTITGLSTLFASVTAGFLWDHYGASTPFIFGALGASFSALLLCTVTNSRPKPA